MYKGNRNSIAKLSWFVVLIVVVSGMFGYLLVSQISKAEALFSSNFKSIYALEGLRKLMDEAYTANTQPAEQQLGKLIKLQKDNMDIAGEAELTFELESLINEYQTAKNLKDDRFIKDVMARIDGQITVLINMNRDEIEFKTMRSNRYLKQLILYGVASLALMLALLFVLARRLEKQNVNMIKSQVITVATRDLSAYEDLYKSLMDKLDFPIALFTEEGEQVYGNRKFNKFLNHLNKKVNDFDQQKELADFLEKIIKEPLNLKFIESINSKYTTLFEGNKVAAEVIDGEKVLKFLMFVNNSHGNLAESFAKAAEDVMAHINSMLMALHASLELGSAQGNSKMLEFIVNARDQGNAAKQILNKALGLQAPGAVVTAHVENDVVATLENVIKSMSAAIDSKHLKLDLVVPPTKIVISSTEGQLKALFTRIISNAIYLAKADETIVVRLGSKDGYAVMCVTNQLYIPREYHEEIFKKDFVSETMHNLNDLALYAARNSAIALDGYLWLESDKAEGSSFWLNIKVENKEI